VSNKERALLGASECQWRECGRRG